MNYFTTITDYILSIKDSLKVLKIKSIRIPDLESYQKFCDMFSIDEFRSSIREYRNINGKENLKHELRLILSAIKHYSKFYSENEVSLNSINTSILLDRLLEPIALEEKRAYNKMLLVNKSITELTGDYKSTCWKLSSEHHKSLAILKNIEVLEKEKKEFKDAYIECYEHRNQLIHKYNNHLNFKFYNVLLKLEIIKEIINEDYLDNIEVLNLNFNNSLLEVINEYFSPTLSTVSAKDFFNNFELSGLKIEKRKMSDTKLYFLIDSFANTIKDELKKEKWVNTALEYFEKHLHTYNKKKTYEIEHLKKTIKIEEKENHFVTRLSKAIKMI